jgi:hypothetical protein
MIDRRLIRYMPPGASDHDRVESRSSPLVTADAQRACYSTPDIPALAEYFERRRAHSRREFVAEVRRHMLLRHMLQRHQACGS